MRDVSEESLLDYFYSAGGNAGRVRNADILRTFKPFIGHSDSQLRGKYAARCCGGGRRRETRRKNGEMWREARGAAERDGPDIQ